MKLFPWWLLLLAGINLLPVFLAPFYLFGGLHPFGESENGLLAFLLYVLTNAVWVAPVLLFFLSLDLYWKARRKAGVAVALAGNVLTAAAAGLLLG